MSKYEIQKNPFKVPTDDGKIILEHFGRASIDNPSLSIAKMTAPPGWGEPFQTPGFEEYTFVIKGRKQFEIDDETIVLGPGESIKLNAGTRVRYSNPFLEPCEYISICSPAFSIESVNREKA